MPDAFTTPEDLIADLEVAAGEFEAVDAAGFGAEARNELAAYRERQLGMLREDQPQPEDGGPDHGGPVIVVPERYQGRAEVFLVFEAFVRFFVDPVLVASAIPDALAHVDSNQQIERLAFRRFGEEQNESTPVRALEGLSDDARTLTAMAAELGSALFGDRFRASDFWAAPQ